MTGKAGAKTSIIGDGSRPQADALMRLTVMELRSTMERLLELGQRYEADLPADSTHVLTLAEQLAGLTLRGLQAWPDGQ